jgi:hypothetical protein
MNYQEDSQALEDQLLEHVPTDGSAIGNRTLKERLRWEEDTYWSVRNELIDAGVLEKGRGKGGSVKLVVEPETADVTTDKAGAVAEESARLYTQETALYKPMRDVIESNWAKDRGVKPILVRVAAAQGRRETGGRWTRPDIVSVSVQTFVHLPGKFIEVVTFEIKPSDGIDVTAVYEALAHRRGATHAYVLLHVPLPHDAALTERVEEICEVAKDNGIGVIVAGDPSNYETWDERVGALRVEPDPAKLDRFIATQLKDDSTRIAQAVR